MIFGIGTDIIEIARVEKAIENERFLRRIFTGREIGIYRSRGCSAKVLAGNFAAKEAVVKALGVGFSSIAPADVEVLRDSLGKPFVCLHGNADVIRKDLNIGKIHLSLSNCRVYATAHAVAEYLE